MRSSKKNQTYSANSQEIWYVDSYRLGTSAVQAFKIPWELNMPPYSDRKYTWRTKIKIKKHTF